MPDSAFVARKLESWKEIASHIGKTERTAKRWERQRGLPVHRVPGGGRQVVFAYADELDTWLHSNNATSAENDSAYEITTAASQPDCSQTAAERPIPPTIRAYTRWLIGIGLCAALVTVAAAVGRLRPPELVATNPNRLTWSQVRVLSPLLSDGEQIYYPRFENGRFAVGKTPANGGDSKIVGTSIGNAELCDLSPDGHSMLLRNLGASRDAQEPIYIWADNGASQRVGEILAYDAAWYPDGKKILYSTVGEVYSTDKEGSSPDRLFAIPGNAFWFRWSPDGNRVRFTVIDQKSEETSVWEYALGARDPHRLLGEVPYQLCCGSWTPDGKFFLFQVRNGNTFQIWAAPERLSLTAIRDKPFPLIFGATSYRGPLPSSDGRRLFVRTETPKDEVVRYDAKVNGFLPVLPGISARTLASSKDGAWIAYTSLTDNNLWRCRADGAECMQLTQKFKDTVMPSWSPDGKTITFMGIHFSGEWGVYAVSAAGGPIQSISHADHAQGFPDWSPDGRQLVFGEVPPVSQPRGLHVLNVATNSISTLPDSADYFFPRWSPDGRYIVALHTGDQTVSLYDFDSQSWRRLVRFSSAYPNWSHDGKTVYFVSNISGSRATYRIKVRDGAMEKVADLSNVERTPFFMGDWVGLAYDDVPLAVRNLTTDDIYAWDLVIK